MGGNFAILNPCPKKWSDLSGTGRVRYCDLCEKNVHALDEYSPVERGALWRESAGHVCGMITAASPEPPRSRRAILIGALLTAAAPLFAQSGRLRIRVTDLTGAVIPNATVSIPRAFVTTATDESGESVITGLPLGDIQMSIRVPGFKFLDKTVTIQGSDEQKLEVTLEIGGMLGEVVNVQIQPPQNSGYIPSPQQLDLPSPQLNLQSPPAVPVKHHWWQVFR